MRISILKYNENSKKYNIIKILTKTKLTENEKIIQTLKSKKIHLTSKVCHVLLGNRLISARLELGRSPLRNIFFQF